MAPTTQTNHNGTGNTQGNVWSEEEIQQILDNVIKVAGDKTFLTEMRELNWDNLKVDGREADDCKAMFVKLTQRTRKHRTMSEILASVTDELPEKIEHVNTASVTKPVSAFLMYMKVKEKDMPAKYLTLPKKKRLEKLRKKWDKSEELRAEYTEKYCVLRDEFKRSREKKTTDQPKVQTPFQVYYSKKLTSKLKKNPEVDRKLLMSSLKVKYNNLSAKKKYRFMCKAMDKVPQFKEECDIYKQKHPDFKAPNNFELHLTREEKNILNDQLSKPQPFPKNSYLFYCSKERPKMSGGSLAEQARRLAAAYGKLDESVKAAYKEEHIEAAANHIEKLSEYRDQVARWSHASAAEASVQIAAYKKIINSKSKRKWQERTPDVKVEKSSEENGGSSEDSEDSTPSKITQKIQSSTTKKRKRKEMEKNATPQVKASKSREEEESSDESEEGNSPSKVRRKEKSFLPKESEGSDSGEDSDPFFKPTISPLKTPKKKGLSPKLVKTD